jgi:hypothetical protein
MVCSARFSCRSPDRFSRWRTTRPELAGSGATPASAANAASERSRPGCDHAHSSCAATIGPTPSTVSKGRNRRGDKLRQLGLQLGRLLLQQLDPAGGRPQRPHGHALLQRLRRLLCQRGTHGDLPAGGAPTNRSRSASRSPRRRGAARCSRASASHAARTASSASLLAPLRRVGRGGRSTSTTHSPCSREALSAWRRSCQCLPALWVPLIRSP